MALTTVAALVLVAVVWFGPILMYPSLSVSDLRGITGAELIQLHSARLLDASLRNADHTRADCATRTSAAPTSAPPAWTAPS